MLGAVTATSGNLIFTGELTGDFNSSMRAAATPCIASMWVAR